MDHNDFFEDQNACKINQNDLATNEVFFFPPDIVVLHTGAVIFDLNASSLSSIAEKVVDALVNKNEIRASDRDSLLRALLMQRR